MTDQLARRQVESIRSVDGRPNPFAEFRPLDRFTGERVQLPNAPSFIATLSAGWKDEKGIPHVSRDGRIHLTDPDNRAPFLREQLEAADYKRLTIAFTSNVPSDIVQERFVCYTQTALQLHGDENSLTFLDGKGGRRVFRAGSNEYQRALAQCMVTRSLYFVLGGWDQNRPRMIFDPRDGFAHYRLRFGSRNSLNNIMSYLAEVAEHTNGEIAGLPLELSLTYRDVADPMGKRRTVPVWSITLKTPEGFTLSASTFRRVATEALEEGRQLRLPPPRPETIELAQSEYRYLDSEDVDVRAPERARLEVLERGAPVNRSAATRRYFAIAKGTRFKSDAGRERFMSAFTDGSYQSLSEWLRSATQQEVDVMLDTLERCVEEDERLPKAWEGLPELDEPEIDRDTGEIMEPDGPDAAVGTEEDDAEGDDPWGSNAGELPAEPGDAIQRGTVGGDPFAADREARERLMAELARLLDQAAAVGYPPEEIAVDELGNADLATAISGLASNLKRYKASLGQAS